MECHQMFMDFRGSSMEHQKMSMEQLKVSMEHLGMHRKAFRNIGIHHRAASFGHSQIVMLLKTYILEVV